MEILHNLGIGFAAAATPLNLVFCLFGCLIGTLIGVLPGIGPIATIAMLLPVTFSLSPLGALIMLAGIYYGAQYGGSTTAILVNLPGESSSVVTCIEGYKMARKGRAGAALAIAAIGSFFAGCVGTVLIAAFAPILAKFAEQFRSPEYFSLMLFGLVAAVVLAHGSVIKAVAMIVLGLLIGLVGTDTQSGVARFTFGPTHTAWSETYYERSLHLQTEVDCGPCQKRVCPLKHHRCMRDLRVSRVYRAAATLLEKYPAQSKAA